MHFSLRCHLCQTVYPAEALWVCSQCLGPLEVTYDYAAIHDARFLWLGLSEKKFRRVQLGARVQAVGSHQARDARPDDRDLHHPLYGKDP